MNKATLPRSPLRELTQAVAGVVLTLVLPGCSTITTAQYDVNALAKYTWQVDYAPNPADVRSRRSELFASTALMNRNGEKPSEAVTGPDERGLWWPALPPRPTVDEIEQRQQTLERPSTPQLIKSVEYQISFQHQGATVTMPTNYDVYREGVKAKRTGASLELTLGLGDRSVEKAEPR